MKLRTLSQVLGVCALVGIAAKPSMGEPVFPQKGVDMIVPFNAGGGTDVAARLFARFLTERWNVPVRVVNKPGAGGIIGTHEALSARPDGHTVLCVGHNVTITPAFAVEEIPYDWRKATFLCRMTVDPLLYLSRVDAPWGSLKQLSEYIRSGITRVRWGATGQSGISHLAGVQYLFSCGIGLRDVDQVSFTGGAPVVAALAGGHIDAAAQQLSEAYGMLRGGRIRALAVVGERRLGELPDLPTAGESGFPMLDTFGWHGIAGPPGIPQSAVAEWLRALREIAEHADFIDSAKKAFKETQFLAGVDFRQFVERQFENQSALAKALKLKSGGS